MRIPSTTSFIKRHISLLPEGVAFSTRIFLGHGRRSAVDKCLGRLVERERIIRVTRGIFIKFYAHTKVKLPSVYEVAQIKARAFGKEIYIYGATAAKHFELSSSADTYDSGFHASSDKTELSGSSRKPDFNCTTPKESAQTIFSVAGQTTSFKYGHNKIILKGISQKYLKSGDSIPGLVIRGLLHAGTKEGGMQHVHTVPGLMRREHKEEVWAAAGQMPWWLSNQFFHPRWDRDALVKGKRKVPVVLIKESAANERICCK